MGYKEIQRRKEKQRLRHGCEMADITSADGGEGVSAAGLNEHRNIPLIAPFGVRWNPPAGIPVQLLKNWETGNSVVAIGTIVDSSLEPGETEIYSAAGATVKCKNDGSVEIKGKSSNAIHLKSGGGVSIESKNQLGLITISDSGSISIVSSSSVTINAPSITHLEG